MGYACPVCEDPQVDAKHLADHLALTALLGDDDHEAWLDDHAPGWTQEDDAWLGERVVDEAERIELPTEGESQARRADFGKGVDATHDPGVAFEELTDRSRAGADPSLDDEAQAALREAYEITQRRRERQGPNEQPDEGDTSETE